MKYDIFLVTFKKSWDFPLKGYSVYMGCCETDIVLLVKKYLLRETIIDIEFEIQGGMLILKISIKSNRILAPIIILLLCLNSLLFIIEFNDFEVEAYNEPNIDTETSNRMNSRSPYIIDLNTTTSYPHHNITIYGKQASDQIGNSLVSGNINNDSFNDLIIGSWSAGGGPSAKGRVWVIYGNSTPSNITDLDAQVDIMIYGPEMGDNFGWSIATGDVNGDNIDDLIVGTPGGDGTSNSKDSSGEVFIFYGNNTPASLIVNPHGSANVKIFGIDEFDRIGRALACGDINGDGIDDIIIGAENAFGPGNARSNGGEVYVIYGSNSLPWSIDLQVMVPDITVYGADSNDFEGCAVSSADMNSDGIDDLIIGAQQAAGPGNLRSACGEVHIIYGNSSFPPAKTQDLQTVPADVTIYGDNPGDNAGSFLTIGDINGDSKDDIILSAIMGNGPGNIRSDCGEVHIVFNNATFPSLIDLAITTHVTIHGVEIDDKIGTSLSAGDFNGDNIDDIIIGAKDTDGPTNSRMDCGEAYIINGSSNLQSTIDLATSQSDFIILYGAESDDFAGRSVLLSNLNGDNKDDIIVAANGADGINNLIPETGEVYIILPKGKNLITNFIGLIEDNKTCYSKYKPYTFEVKVTHIKGLIYLNNISLSLDYQNENLQYSWFETTKEFSEIYDPYNYAELDTSSSYRTDGKTAWFLDFNITFNWSYPDNFYHGIQVHSISDNGIHNWLNLTDNIYRVENHLNFTGDLNIRGNFQGPLTEGDWVRGGEEVTWEGLKVVYDGTNNIYPPDDSGVSVTVWDSDSDFWGEIPNPGENILISSIVDNETKLNEIFKINISGVPPYCDNSDVTFELNIDADNVSFSNSLPNEDQWQGTLTPNCGISISDTTTEVNGSSIQYRISLDNGTTWNYDWADLDPQKESSESIDCIIKPVLKEGKDNLIQWRAKDIVGNGFNESEEYRVLIDTSNVIFTNAIPSSNEWQDNLSVICNITVVDNLSGVNASSIEIRISTGGPFSYGSWQSAKQIINDNIVQCSVNPTFLEGENNYIKWRAKDVAGNGPYLSDEYQIKIKLNRPPESTLISPNNDIIIRDAKPELVWKGMDPDGDMPIHYNVYLSLDENEIVNLDVSALLKSDLIDTKYEPEMALEDGLIYYWTVIPNDGKDNGICISGVWHFKIDTTIEIPKVTLISPINNSNVSTKTPTFSWNINYSEMGSVTYTIFIDTSSNPQNYSENIGSTSYIRSTQLFEGLTYYWTVIPIANTGEGKIQGICISGVWSFTIEPEFVHVYGVNLEIETIEFNVKPGEYIFTNIIVTNIGNSNDMFKLELDERVIDANIALEHSSTPISLDSNENITLKLEILISDTVKVQEYTISVTAISNGALTENKEVSITKSIQINVIEKDEKTDQDFMSSVGWILIILIIIVIILIAFTFLYRKKKATKVPVLKAELIHKPTEIQTLPSLSKPPILDTSIEPKPELPTPVMGDQPKIVTAKTPVPELMPKIIKPQLQLPQATLSKTQQLNLLRERLLRGEISEETYKELKREIESNNGDNEVIEDTNDEPENNERLSPLSIEHNLQVPPLPKQVVMPVSEQPTTIEEEMEE